MSAVAVFLIAVGIADLCRRAVPASWPPLTIGPVAVALCAALGALWHRGDVPLLVLATAATVAWEWLCRRSERSGKRQVAPLAVFAAALALLTVLSGWSSPVDGVVARWSGWVHLPLNHVAPNPPADDRRCGAGPVRHRKSIGAPGAWLRGRGTPGR